MTMRILFAALMMAGLAAGPVAAAPAAFEGAITLSMEHGGKAMPTTWLIKGTKTRMEMDGGPHGDMVMIFDSVRQAMVMLMPAQKMYMEMPVPKRPAGGGKGKDVKVVKTGKKETILGYVCEQYLATGEREHTEIWAAKGLGSFAPLGGGMSGGPRAEWENEMVRGGYFPLRLVNRDAAGQTTMSMTATKIEPKKLADALFVPPDDYKPFTMPAGMPAGMPGAPSAGN